MNLMATWRVPDGRCFRISTGGDAAAVLTLQPVAQDSDTGTWRTAAEPRADVAGDEFRSTYVEVPAEPLRDPRITRLGRPVDELLADYEDHTGSPACSADEIRAAYVAVAAIPDEALRRRLRAGVMGVRAGFRRGRQL